MGNIAGIPDEMRNHARRVSPRSIPTLRLIEFVSSTVLPFRNIPIGVSGMFQRMCVRGSL